MLLSLASTVLNFIAGGNSKCAYICTSDPVLPSAQLRWRKARLGTLTATCRDTFQLGGTILAPANYYRLLLVTLYLPAKPVKYISAIYFTNSS